MADTRVPLAIIEGIPYGRGRTERFDLYAADWKRSRRPVVVLLHGNWKQPRARKPYMPVARALVEDGMTVALLDYAPVSVAWPQQLTDLRRALTIIAREAEGLGGDSQRLILCGDGLGAFLVTQLVMTQQQVRWLAPTTGRIVAWMTNDSFWSEESLSDLQSGHAMKQLFPNASAWNCVRPLNMVTGGLPPLFVIQPSSASLEHTERFVCQTVALGNEVTLISRPENASRVWRGISNRSHPLRVSWRPWLQRWSVTP